MDTELKNVAFIRPNNSVENVSRFRLFLAPDQLTEFNLFQATRHQMTITETVSDFTAQEANNMTKVGFFYPKPTPEEGILQYSPPVIENSPGNDQNGSDSSENQPTSPEITHNTEDNAEDDPGGEHKPNTEALAM